MRVLFLASYFPRPTKPAIGTWALQQAFALARAVDLRVACCTSYIPALLGLHPRAKPWTTIPSVHQWDNVTAHYLKTLYYPVNPLKRWAYPDPERQMNIAWKSASKRLLSLVDEFQPDVLYAHHTAVNGYFAERLHRLTRLPYVITDHDFEEIRDCERYPARRALFARVLNSASRHISVAKRMHADVTRLFPDARATVVYNGINPHPPALAAVPRPTELADKIVVLSAGMYAPRKGFPLLVEAFAKVAHKFPSAVLRIAGDGEQRPLVEQAVHAAGLTNRVHLLGLMPQKQLFQEMAWADLFALIGWDEPFATVFIEAMGAGKPILTANDGGINDVVRDGVHGRSVPPKNAQAAADALEQLLSDPAARTKMGENARNLVAQSLTWDANARQLTAIFREALDSRSPTAIHSP